ncbi:MAG: hypothetical protein M4579_000919 [Chaenotheca gracillima]|nr:MAG: hypothetical protein M4579_000919 [Chaenotheca gracillima]
MVGASAAASRSDSKNFAIPSEGFLEALKQLPDDGGTVAWRILANASEHAKILHRFTDIHQTQTDEKPLPNGSNIDMAQKPRLKMMNMWYHGWLSWLHYKSLVVVRSQGQESKKTKVLNASRIAELDRLKDILEGMVKEEEKYITPKLGSFQSPEGLGWIQDFRNSVTQTLGEMQESTRPFFGSADIPQAHHSSEYLQAFQSCTFDMSKIYMNSSIHTKLLALLLDRADSFEKSMAKRHVEDVYITKRVRLLTDQDAATLDEKTSESVKAQYGPKVINTIREIGQLTRQVFDFRLLHDWGHGRPWRKLFLMLDTDTIPGLAEAIQTTKIEFARPWGTWRTVGDLFDVHPKDKSKLPPDDLCVICYSEWEDQDLVMKTWCNHNFHHTCIFRFWDDEKHRPKSEVGDQRAPTQSALVASRLNALAARQHIRMGKAIPEYLKPWIIAERRRYFVRKDLVKFEGVSEYLPEFTPSTPATNPPAATKSPEQALPSSGIGGAEQPHQDDQSPQHQQTQPQQEPAIEEFANDFGDDDIDRDGDEDDEDEEEHDGSEGYRDDEESLESEETEEVQEPEQSEDDEELENDDESANEDDVESDQESDDDEAAPNNRQTGTIFGHIAGISNFEDVAPQIAHTNSSGERGASERFPYILPELSYMEDPTYAQWFNPQSGHAAQDSDAHGFSQHPTYTGFDRDVRATLAVQGLRIPSSRAENAQAFRDASGDVLMNDG